MRLGCILGGQDDGPVDFPATPIQNITATRSYGRGQEGVGREGRAGGPVAAAEKRAKGVQDTLELSPEARKQLAELKARDTQVRAHEAAHLSAGGGVVRGGASFSYQRGPDGGMYAVGGEVSIDASPVPDNPRATIAKAQQIRAAALAPADPSSQDRKVAAAAAAMASQAATELAKTSQTKGRGLDLMA